MHLCENKYNKKAAGESDDGSEGVGKEQRIVTTENVRFRRSLNLILTESAVVSIMSSPKPSSPLPTKPMEYQEGHPSTPPGPDFEPIETTAFLVNTVLSAALWVVGGGAVACPILPRHQPTCPKIAVVGDTCLSYTEGGCAEGSRGVTSNSPLYDNHQRVHGVKGTRLDERYDNDHAQPTDSNYPQGSTNVSGGHMSVRRMLSATKTGRYGRLKSMAVVSRNCLPVAKPDRRA